MERVYKVMTESFKLSESRKATLVSSLILTDGMFNDVINSEKSGDLILDIVKDRLSSVNDLDSIIGELSFILFLNDLKYKKDLEYIYDCLNNNILNDMKGDDSKDLIGLMYNGLSVGGGDKGNLGIVLTPEHITNFMCDLTGVNKESVVVDPCVGSGAFLIAAHNKILKDGGEIKNNLYGVEFSPSMYIMAAANMYIRTGKINILKNSIFDVIDDFKDKKPNVVLINPPYSQKAKGETEYDFILESLKTLSVGGKLAAIVPMSVAINLNKDYLVKRKQLLKEHTLDAVFSMGSHIFEPNASTTTCILVITAGVPHDIKNKVFFGFLKDDGFYKTRKCIVNDGRWDEIRIKFLKMFKNKDNVAGLCSSVCVDFNDEWCAEAYMETDYSTLTDDDFIKSIKEYSAFKMLNSDLFEV